MVNYQFYTPRNISEAAINHILASNYQISDLQMSLIIRFKIVIVHMIMNIMTQIFLQLMDHLNLMIIHFLQKMLILELPIIQFLVIIAQMV